MLSADATLIAEAMNAAQRDAVQLALALAHRSPMPDSYTRAAQELDALVALRPLRTFNNDPARLTKAALGAILSGRVRWLARERQQVSNGALYAKQQIHA